MTGWSAPFGTVPLFVGSYSSAGEQGIHVVLLDAERRARIVGSIGGITNPSFVLVHPEGRHLYSVSETGVASHGREGSVEAFRLDPGSGEGPQAVSLGRQPTGGDHPCHLAIDPQGRWLVASNYGGGSFSVFPIGADGEILASGSTVGHTGSGRRSDRQEAPHVHASAFTSDGRMLLVADLGIDRVVGYAFEPSDGRLERVAEVDTGPGSGPRQIAIHPDGAHVFVVNELSNTVSILRYDPHEVRLDVAGRVDALLDPSVENLASAIRVGHDGTRVLVSNRGEDSIVIFEFSPDTGLVRVGGGPCGSWPRDFALLDDLRCIAVANRRDDTVAIIALADGGTAFGPVLDTVPVREPACVTIG